MSRTKDSGTDGFLVIDKQGGMTSHTVVSQARRALEQRRCGHCGTLDPDATGILLLGFGQITKVLSHLTVLKKTYTCEVVFGTTTNTLDDSGEITEHFDMGDLDFETVKTHSQAFVGNILQIPPMVSALKVDGVRLHKLARSGIEVERKARPVTVYRIDIGEKLSENVFTMSVTCSSGTYVRTLAADLGTALGGGAHLRNLVRTQIGSFGLSEAVLVSELTSSSPLLTGAQAMRDYPSLVMSPAQDAYFRAGRKTVAEDDQPQFVDGPVVSVLDTNGQLIGVGRVVGGTLFPATVFTR